MNVQQHYYIFNNDLKIVLENKKTVSASQGYLAKHQSYEISILRSNGKLHGGMEIEYLIQFTGNNDMSGFSYLGT